MNSMRRRSEQALALWLSCVMSPTGVEVSPALISKVTSGASVPTIPGPRDLGHTLFSTLLGTWLTVCAGVHDWREHQWHLHISSACIRRGDTLIVEISLFSAEDNAGTACALL